MKEIYLPNWFFRRLSDNTLVRLDLLSQDDGGVFVRVDLATAAMWRRGIAKGA